MMRLAALFLLLLPMLPMLALSVQPVPAVSVANVSVPLGERLPQALLQGLNGPHRRMSHYRGQPLIINVWASWCGPCRREMASLERLAWQEHGVGYRVIGVSVDDYPERALAFLKQANATISHFIDSQMHIESMLGATRLPLTVFVDSDGRVLKRVYGARDWSSREATQLVAQLFEGAGLSAQQPTSANARAWPSGF